MSVEFDIGHTVLVWNDGDTCMPIDFAIGKNRVEIMQYIGIKDKNGNLVFEGDIVIVFNKTANMGKVVFDNGMYCVRSAKYKVPQVLLQFKEDIEIIGNIYENPELIK